MGFLDSDGRSLIPSVDDSNVASTDFIGTKLQLEEKMNSEAQYLQLLWSLSLDFSLPSILARGIGEGESKAPSNLSLILQTFSFCPSWLLSPSSVEREESLFLDSRNSSPPLLSIQRSVFYRSENVTAPRLQGACILMRALRRREACFLACASTCTFVLHASGHGYLMLFFQRIILLFQCLQNPIKSYQNLSLIRNKFRNTLDYLI